ncbi:MAG TPA: hypothetical protein VHG52_14270 [Thermomicrobiales bacterium]|nr:hypothetical protein [Thermomicrobiales bacterium]
MSTNRQSERQERRSRRSLRIGIIALVALVVLVIAIIWGIENWSEDDQEGPSVDRPTELVFASWDYLAS